MFLCADHHTAHPGAWLCDMLASRGPCESCGEVATCADCHYTPPDVSARVNEIMRQHNREVQR